MYEGYSIFEKHFPVEKALPAGKQVYHLPANKILLKRFNINDLCVGQFGRPNFVRSNLFLTGVSLKFARLPAGRQGF